MFRLQTTVTREGWFYMAIVLIVFGGAVSKEVNLLLILAGMMFCPLLINWGAVRSTLRGLRVERQLPLRSSAGEVFSVGLTVADTRPRLSSWAVVVEEQISPECVPAKNDRRRPAPLRPSVLFPYVQAGGEAKGSYRGALTRRGRYRFGPLRLTTRFPFGLFSRTITVGPVETLTILPRLGKLTRVWNARQLEAIAGADRRRRRPGTEGDFYGVREWRQGDSQRLIHWRGFARRGTPVVRQFERPQSRDAAVLLDLWQPPTPTDSELDTVELAVSFAGTLLADLCRSGGCNVYLGLSGPAHSGASPAPADSTPSEGNGERRQAPFAGTARRGAPMRSAGRRTNGAGPLLPGQSAEFLGGPASSVTLQGLMERLAVAEAQTDDTLPATLAQALPRIAAGTEIVLVGTRPIDLADMSRFGALWSDPMLHERMRHIRQVDASSPGLSEYFQADP
jgi:uncharacterized protein (DUF58 family)